MTRQKENIIFDFYQKTKENDFVFTYRGLFLKHLTARLVEIGESINNKGIVKRKMSFLLVECFQNILRYSENASANSNGYFSFRILNGTFIINSINLVKTKDIPELIQRVTEVNLLNQKELKKVYLQRLETGQFNEKGGAGLGLIEIARKSGRKLQYKIDEIDGDLYNFHQQVTLCNREVLGFEDIDLIREAESDFKAMEKNDILMEYKGDFSRTAILPLLDIIENSVAEKKTLKRVGHVMIEMLQNISKHNSNKSDKVGVCSIINKGDDFIINTGNIVDIESIENLKKKINLLNGMTKEELSRYHSKRILEVYDKENDISSELGLIEIAKYSSKKLEIDFNPNCEKGKSFFSFHASI